MKRYEKSTYKADDLHGTARNGQGILQAARARRATKRDKRHKLVITN